MNVKLKPDKVLRDRFYTAESYQHPAKGHLGLWWEILERYTREGETILDPMAGVGATMLGALMGRNVICVEMESHFVSPMLASWEKMRQSPMLGHSLGQVVILRGDARCLPIGRADAVITSPPFQDQLAAHDPRWFEAHRSEFGGGAIPGSSYTRPSAQVDAAIFSPPYADNDLQGGETKVWAEKFGTQSHNHGYNNNQGENIGNLRGPAYWEAMRQVYAECHRVLKPGGLMVLVVKGFVRAGFYQDLPLLTRQLCETLGFRFVETWRRELWSLSFWRILQQRRDPAAFDSRLRFEEVLVLERSHGPL